MDINTLIHQYANWIYAAVIYLGGGWGVKYFRVFNNKTHDFLLFSTIFAILFLSLEIYITESFDKNEALKYLFTYVCVTSFYEVIGQKIKRFVGNLLKKKE